jgi:uncharacterized protein (TIGR02145 family)
MKSVVLIISIVFSFCAIAQKAGKFKDKRDGKVYPTVKIGEQTWMAENLNAATFRNGDPIPEVKTFEEWQKAGENHQPAWCYYDFRKIQDDPINGAKYGKLYNWYAVNDPRGLAPEGWHVSTDDDWTTLSNTVGGKEKAGYKLKSRTGWIDWNFENSNDNNRGNGIDLYGFNALPGGEIVWASSFLPYFGIAPIGLLGSFWTSTQTKNEEATNVLQAFSFNLHSQGLTDALSIDYIKREVSWCNHGHSVRCVKD